MSFTQGTVVADGIVPLGSNATHYDVNGYSGYRAVATLAERDAIAVTLRGEKMLVGVVEDGKYYELKLGTASGNLADNGNWVEFASSDVDKAYVDAQDAAVQNFVITERDALYDHVDQADTAINIRIDSLANITPSLYVPIGDPTKRNISRGVQDGSNTYGANHEDNTYEANHTNNVYRDGFYNNRYGANHQNNTYSYYTGSNVFGDGHSYNTYGVGLSDSVFMNSLERINVGNYCMDLIMGPGQYYVNIGDNCSHLEIYDCHGTPGAPFVIPANTSHAVYRNNVLIGAGSSIDPATLVHTTGDESLAGIKNFTGSIKVADYNALTIAADTLNIGDSNLLLQLYLAKNFQWRNDGTYKGMALNAQGDLAADGTVTASAFIGDGLQLTGIPQFDTPNVFTSTQQVVYPGTNNVATINADSIVIQTDYDGTAAVNPSSITFVDINGNSTYFGMGGIVFADGTSQTTAGGGGGGTVDPASDTVAGIAKLYNSTSTATDGGITPAAVAIADGVLNAAIQTKAPLASPAFTGSPTAPTATVGTNSTRIATTAFVYNAVSNKVDKSATNQTFLGYNAGGTGNVSAGGDGITAIGASAALNNYANNGTFVGVGAGRSNTSGPNNSYFGAYAGQNNQTGVNNTYFGFFAGRLGTSGVHNVFFGSQTGESTTGNYCTFLGSLSGRGNATGSNHIALGYSSGPASGALDNTISIGAGAQATTSNTMFVTDSVNVGIGIQNPASKLTVNGDVEVSSGIVMKSPDGTRYRLTVANGGTPVFTAI